MFITSDYLKPNKGGNIYTDLAEELKNSGHDIKVVVAEEKKKISKTTLEKERNIPVLRVKVGNLYEVGLVEKAITFLTLSKCLKKEINNYFKNEKFDLILYQSPPLTMCSVVKWAMRKYKAKSYLMMKDIFPQNGVDIGLYSKKSPIYWFFRIKEKKLYKTSSKIGCMSNGNIKYLLDHNKFLSKEKLELFPNTVKLNNNKPITKKEKIEVRKKYGLRESDIVAIYGGNFGRPQGLDFLVEVIKEYQDKPDLKFVLIGKGTEKKRIYDKIKDENLKNVITYDYIPRKDYENLTASCDIGLIFLDKRFTIPNYPSKTLSYFECFLPIMAAIDKNTDYSELLEKEKCGYWVENGNLKEYKKKFDKLLDDSELRKKMGENGHKYLKEKCNVIDSVKILERYVGDKNV